MKPTCRIEDCENELTPEDFTCCWDHQYLDGEYMVRYYMRATYTGD